MTGNQTSQATYGGSLVAVVGGLSLNEVLAMAGLAVALAGFVVNLVYRHREDRRAVARHAALMRDGPRGDGQAGDGQAGDGR